MDPLTLTSTIIAYGVVAALGVFGQKTSYLTASQLVMGGDNWRILDLAPPILSIVYLGLDASDYGDPRGWQSIVVGLGNCTSNYEDEMNTQDAVDGKGVKLSCSGLKKLASTWLLYTYVALIGVQIVCGIVFAICWYGSKWTSSAGKASEFRLHVRRHKWWYRILPKVGLAINILLTIAMVISIWIFRFCVDRVVDLASNQDSQWSIGQVLAPAAWIPSVLDIATWMYGCFRRRCKFVPILSGWAWILVILIFRGH